MTTAVLAGTDPGKVQSIVNMARDIVIESYMSGRGLAASPHEPYKDQIWTRDFSLAAMAIAGSYEGEVIQTFLTILDSQRGEGSLPHRIEWVRHSSGYVLRWLGIHHLPILYNLLNRRRGKYAVYGDSWLAAPARDTVALLVIVLGEMAKSGKAGLEFANEQWRSLEFALYREEQYLDHQLGLISGGHLQDWCDSVLRPGALSLVNILDYQACKVIAEMASTMNNQGIAKNFQLKMERRRSAINEHLWDEEHGFFTSGIGDSRLDTVANIFACIFLTGSTTAARIQSSLTKRVRGPQGFLKCFDRPYPRKQMSKRVRYFGMEAYGNTDIYPWISALNIRALLMTAQLQTCPASADVFKEEALGLFHVLTDLFASHGEIYEVYDGQTLKPSVYRKHGRVTYQSCPGFLGSAATYLSAFNLLKSQGLL